MKDFIKSGDRRKDSFIDAISNKTVFKKGNKLCYKDIYDENNDYEIGDYEISITRRTVAKVIVDMRQCSEGKRELTYNDVGNISQAYYESKYDPKSLHFIAAELADFYDNISDENRIRLALFLVKHYQSEVSTGVKTRISDVLDFMVYNLSKGGITVDTLHDIGFFDQITILDGLNMVKNDLITKKQLRDIIVSDVEDYDDIEIDYEKIAFIYSDFADKPGREKVALKFLKLLEGDEACKLYLKGLLTDKELKALKPNRDSLLKLDVDDIIKINGNKYVYSLTSEDIFKNYGEKFLVKDLIKFADKNMVKPEKIIKVLLLKSLGNYDIDLEQERRDILGYYSGKRILDLHKNDKINNRFIDVFNSELIEKVSEEEKKKYFENFRSDILDVSKDKIDFINNSIELYENGILNKEFYNKDDFDLETTLQVYSDGELSEDNLFRLYNDKIVPLDVICDLYTSDELLKFYVDGKLNSDILKSIPKDDAYVFLSTSVENGKLNSKDIYDCYIRDNIDLEQFGEILSDNNSQDNISDFINENTGSEKIKELYTSFIISDDELEKLNKRGFISEDECEKIRNLLQKDEFFDGLKKKKSIFIGGEEQHKEKVDDGYRKTTSFSRGEKKINKMRISSDTIKDFYEEIGGMREYPVILGNTSLAGYSIVGFPDYDLVILENFDKVQNATYIMSFQQLLFYKNNEHKANVEFDIGGKSVLRSSDKVKVHNHTSGFGKNIVSSIKGMSKVASEKFKIDREYKEIIGEYINDIRDEYEKNR
ncbi:MAG: hypothetical protein IKF52_06265 [Clostridia bacterium]|nr:hypothetical protein [Clostridia bacterium]